MAGRSQARDREVLTLTEAALLVGVSDDLLKREVAQGRLVARRVGRSWRFTRRSLLEWIDGRGRAEN